MRRAGTLSGDGYEAWVAGLDPETCAAKGRLRSDGQAVRFVEVVVNGPKSWSLDAELHPDISTAYEASGYTICNDVSSRPIEGENPLYLPQAKTYLGSCALGPWITPYWDIAGPYDLGIHLTIERDGGVAWQGHASTNEVHRKLNDLVEYLFRADEFPDGVVLSTGTSLVPDLPFTLMAGDIVRIAIDGLGELTIPSCEERQHWHN